MQPNSPLFPAELLTLVDEAAAAGGAGGAGGQFVPQLPPKPLAASGSLQVYVIPAEKTLFVDGFQPCEYAERPPTILRGCLYVRVLKPAKVKTITLSFRGVLRTDWPEGIPPKRTSHAEVNNIVSHTWPFYQAGNPLHAVHGGADHYQPPADQISHLSLAETLARSPSPMPRRATDVSVGSHASGGVGTIGEFFARTISLSPAIKRASTATPLAPSTLSLSPVGSHDPDDTAAGLFAAGDYIYNFEHPIPLSTPELCKVTYGEVEYVLEAQVTRLGTFKLNLTGKLPVHIVRVPAENNLEANEPIVISRDWEDQLKYDIVIGSKLLTLNTYLPLAFRFVPLFGKVALHRIRVYLTENLEYYCNDKKVHRMEPPLQYLILEHKAMKGKSLLLKGGGTTPSAPLLVDGANDEDEVLPRELEFQAYVPQVLHDKLHHEIHPDTAIANIQAHHWIKICLRILRFDPQNPGKRKHYEIRIDLPITVLAPECMHANTLLPAYPSEARGDRHLPVYSLTLPPLLPESSPSAILGSLNVAQPSLDAIMDSGERPLRLFLPLLPLELAHRSLSPSGHEFLHLASSLSNDEPIERDPHMHLEANLYLPDEETDAQIHSPQAVPQDSPVASRFASPVGRPIHLLRKPSFNPPPFEAVPAGPPMLTNPPPQYEELDGEPGELHDRGRRRQAECQWTVTPATPVARVLPSRGDRHNVADVRPEEQDIADVLPYESPPGVAPAASPQRAHSPLRVAHLSTHTLRALSITLVNSDISMPLERQPLLNESTTSLGRNALVASLLQNGAKKQSFGAVDLDDEVFKISGNLLLLRNPRIKKHYQHGAQEVPEEGSSSSRTSAEELAPQEVPGLNLGYVVD